MELGEAAGGGGWAPPTADDPRLDERLRLLSWATVPERHRYLAVLRAIDEARERFSLQVRPHDVQQRLAQSGEEPPSIEPPSIEPPSIEPPSIESVTDWLDSLARWGVLHQSFDASRARTVAEFRRHRPVYQFTELGLRAYRLVEELAGVATSEAQLHRVALAAVVDDLVALAAANAAGDDDQCLLIVDRVTVMLQRLSERAADFFVVVAALGLQVEADATRFMELKDLLLTHLQDFLTELQRTRPRVLAAIAAIEATGVDTLVERLAAADTAVLRTPAERARLWRSRWDGLVEWFRPAADPATHPARAGSEAGQRPMVERLDRGTTRAIADLVALLRRLGERHGRGESRATALERLARRFASAPSPADAHRLFATTFELTGARHLGMVAPGEDDPAQRASWQDAPPVVVPYSIRSQGREASPGRAAPLTDDRAAQRHLRDRLSRHLAEAEATVDRLAHLDLAVAELDTATLAALLDLVGVALQSGVPVVGSVEPATERGATRLVVRATPGRHTVVRARSGRLVVHDCTLELEGGPGGLRVAAGVS